MPVQTSVRLEGDDKIREGLNRFSAALPDLTREDLRLALEAAKEKIIEYPPELPGQRYVRTGNYGRSFTVDLDGLTATLKGSAYQNGKDYTVFVGGNAEGFGQADIHYGRWPVIADEAARAADTLKPVLDDDIQKLAQQEGIGL